MWPCFKSEILFAINRSLGPFNHCWILVFWIGSKMVWQRLTLQIKRSYVIILAHAEWLVFLRKHQIQILPDMYNKQNKTVNQTPESDLLMEFKLGCGFQNQKGILKATNNGKRGFLIGLLSLSQIWPSFTFISAVFSIIFSLQIMFSINYFEDVDIYTEMTWSPVLYNILPSKPHPTSSFINTIFLSFVESF